MTTTSPIQASAAISDTGELPPEGGYRYGGVLLQQTYPILEGAVLFGTTNGYQGYSVSTAGLTNLVVFPGTAFTIHANSVRAVTQIDNTYAIGWTEIGVLYFGGQRIFVTGAPNQVVQIPGVATLIINEQTTTISGDFRQVSVSALHLIVPGVADVVIAHARSGARGYTPRTEMPPCHELLSASGQIQVGNSHGSFSAVLDCDSLSATTQGQLQYVDWNLGLEVKSTGVTAYTSDGLNGRRIEGTCTVNGQAGLTYVVDVTDNAMAGVGSDTFRITLSNGYSAAGTLTAGDVLITAKTR